MFRRMLIHIFEKLINCLQSKNNAFEKEKLAEKTIKSYNQHDRVIHWLYGHGRVAYLDRKRIFLEIDFDRLPNFCFSGIQILSLTKVEDD